METRAEAETLEDRPFGLNQRQPVPPDFRAAYQRKALITVEFFKERPDTSQGIAYPQGIEPDRQVHQSLKNFRAKYPQVEFFAYDITKPGNAETSEELNQGEYGTLAAQLEVGYTPFVAMLAPRGEGYVIENLFHGYVERGVLDQALFDLTSSDVGGNSSDVDVTFDRVELTESGGSIEYITLTNRGNGEADFGGFVLRVLEPETGEISDAVESVGINENVRLAFGEMASIGREPGIVDADGREVVGTFEGGETLSLRAGDQVALLDGGGSSTPSLSRK